MLGGTGGRWPGPSEVLGVTAGNGNREAWRLTGMNWEILVGGTGTALGGLQSTERYWGAVGV